MNTKCEVAEAACSEQTAFKPPFCSQPATKQELSHNGTRGPTVLRLRFCLHSYENADWPCFQHNGVQQEVCC